MKTKGKIFKITKDDFIKANKIASREIELENSTGWVCVNKIHKNKKVYNRKNNRIVF